MKVSLRLLPFSRPLSKPTATIDAHYHRCCYRRHYCHHRCVRRKDREIDDLCTFNLFPFSFLMFTRTLFVVSTRCLIYDPRTEHALWCLDAFSW